MNFFKLSMLTLLVVCINLHAEESIEDFVGINVEHKLSIINSQLNTYGALLNETDIGYCIETFSVELAQPNSLNKLSININRDELSLQKRYDESLCILNKAKNKELYFTSNNSSVALSSAGGTFVFMKKAHNGTGLHDVVSSLAADEKSFTRFVHLNHIESKVNLFFSVSGDGVITEGLAITSRANADCFEYFTVEMGFVVVKDRFGYCEGLDTVISIDSTNVSRATVVSGGQIINLEKSRHTDFNVDFGDESYATFFRQSFANNPTSAGLNAFVQFHKEREALLEIASDVFSFYTSGQTDIQVAISKDRDGLFGRFYLEENSGTCIKYFNKANYSTQSGDTAIWVSPSYYLSAAKNETDVDCGLERFVIKNTGISVRFIQNNLYFPGAQHIVFRESDAVSKALIQHAAYHPKQDYYFRPIHVWTETSGVPALTLLIQVDKENVIQNAVALHDKGPRACTLFLERKGRQLYATNRYGFCYEIVSLKLDSLVYQDPMPIEINGDKRTLTRIDDLNMFPALRNVDYKKVNALYSQLKNEPLRMKEQIQLAENKEKQALLTVRASLSEKPMKQAKTQFELLGAYKGLLYLTHSIVPIELVFAWEPKELTFLEQNYSVVDYYGAISINNGECFSTFYFSAESIELVDIGNALSDCDIDRSNKGVFRNAREMHISVSSDHVDLLNTIRTRRISKTDCQFKDSTGECGLPLLVERSPISDVMIKAIEKHFGSIISEPVASFLSQNSLISEEVTNFLINKELQRFAYSEAREKEKEREDQIALQKAEEKRLMRLAQREKKLKEEMAAAKLKRRDDLSSPVTSSRYKPLPVLKSSISGPFSNIKGGIYLNAIYQGDFEEIRKYQRYIEVKQHNAQEKFFGPTEDDWVLGSFKWLIGVSESLTPLIEEVAYIYTTNYENLFQNCLEVESSQVTIDYEGNDSEIFGGLGPSSVRNSGWRYQYSIKPNLYDLLVRSHRDSSADLIAKGAGSFIGADVGLKLDVRNATYSMMRQYACDSEVILQFESNLMRAVNTL